VFNFCALSGHVLEEPEFRIQIKDTPVVTFKMSLWVEREHIGWVRVMCLGQLVDVALEHLHPDTRVAVRGSLNQCRWRTHDAIWHEEHYVKAMELEIVVAGAVPLPVINPEEDGHGLNKGPIAEYPS
jgi:single-stranded DNA-binding protein